jgi:hypothetical protein
MTVMLVVLMAALGLAPVQVQIEQEGRVTLYDCYPSAHAPDEGMSVFLNMPQGLAIYQCGLVISAPIQVLPPTGVRMARTEHPTRATTRLPRQVRVSLAYHTSWPRK